MSVFTLLLRKSVKSLQLVLNEFLLFINNSRQTITKSAFSQARKKLRHTAFIELDKGITSLYYQENTFEKRYGLRILGIDATKLTLPDTPELHEKFGSKPIKNQTDQSLGAYSSITWSACYDVLNRVMVHSILGGVPDSETKLAEQMLDDVKPDDLLIFDRGYVSYPLMANLTQRKIHYLIRCKRRAMKEMEMMFDLESPESCVVPILAKERRKEMKEKGLPQVIKVRLVRVILPTGEPEVLVTSLLDEDHFPTSIFSELYYLRWNVETFFSIVKGRLALENFTGKSVEAVLQDVYSTILLSNLETILVEELEETINQEREEGQLPRKINKSISFNAIKNLAFELLTSNMPENEILEKLTHLFLTGVNVIRKDRQVPRENITYNRSLAFQKRIRKHVF